MNVRRFPAALAGAQTADFLISSLLILTYSGGNAIKMAMRTNQSGFVDGSTLGVVITWIIRAELIDNTGMATNTALVFSPSGMDNPTGAPISCGPTTIVGATFDDKSPTVPTVFRLFSSVGPGVDAWDFPLDVRFHLVPYSAAVGLLASGAAPTSVFWRKRRQTKVVCLKTFSPNRPLASAHAFGTLWQTGQLTSADVAPECGAR